LSPPARERLHEDQGYNCEDRSKTCPYDLRCSKGQEVLHVEVKGTQTDGGEVFLTPGEVQFARSHKGQMALFVLHSIQVAEGDDGFVLSGGERPLIQPWDVDQGTLVPVSFKYGVPTSHVG
jgi:Protein NO VEIN, C-terminal